MKSVTQDPSSRSWTPDWIEGWLGTCQFLRALLFALRPAVGSYMANQQPLDCGSHMRCDIH